MAERSEAKSAKRSFSSKIKFRDILTRSLASRFSLRYAEPFLAKFQLTTNWSFYLQGLKFEKIKFSVEFSLKKIQEFEFMKKLLLLFCFLFVLPIAFIIVFLTWTSKTLSSIMKLSIQLSKQNTSFLFHSIRSISYINELRLALFVEAFKKY